MGQMKKWQIKKSRLTNGVNGGTIKLRGSNFDIKGEKYGLQNNADVERNQRNT